MYDPEKSKRIGKTKDDPAPASVAPFNWKALPMEDLIRFRDEITACLPPLTLRDMDMEQELLLQYHALRALQNDVISDSETAVNQKAQVANSVSATLAKIADLQETLYDSERLKRIEKILISCLDQLPIPVSEAFLTKYEEELEKV